MFSFAIKLLNYAVFTGNSKIVFVHSSKIQESFQRNRDLNKLDSGSVGRDLLYRTRIKLEF